MIPTELKQFIPKNILLEEVKECFGHLPEGDWSAMAQGCHDCEMFLDFNHNPCSNATEYLRKKKHVSQSK